MRFDEGSGRDIRVRVAEAALPTGARVHGDERRGVPLERAVGLRRHGGDRVSGNVDLHLKLANIVLNDSLIICARLGACSSEVMKFLACSKLMCGGSGGTSGSVWNSMTHGFCAASASSHPAATRSHVSTFTPCSPIDSAYCAYGKSGT